MAPAVHDLPVGIRGARDCKVRGQGQDVSVGLNLMRDGAVMDILALEGRTDLPIERDRRSNGHECPDNERSKAVHVWACAKIALLARRFLLAA